MSATRSNAPAGGGNGKVRGRKRRGESKIVVQYREELAMKRAELMQQRENPAGKDEAAHNADVRELRMKLEQARVQLALAILSDQITEQRDMKSLDLVSRGFAEVPEAISALSSLTELDISFNTIREIEPFIFSQLPHLRIFKAVQNEIVELPDTIRDCAGLERLDLRWNFLSELPPALFECTKLTELAVSYNQITELPSTVSTLAALRILKLDVNRMSVLPSLKGLDSLQVLAMSKLGTYEEKQGGTKREKAKRRKFGALPSDIESCTALTELYAVNNQIKELPDAVCKLTKLRKLHLNGNRIAALPAAFTNLTNLHECDLSRNRLTRAAFSGLNLDLMSTLFPQPGAPPPPPGLEPFFSIAGNIGINALDDLAPTRDDQDAADDHGSDSSDG